MRDLEEGSTDWNYANDLRNKLIEDRDAEVIAFAGRTLRTWHNTYKRYLDKQISPEEALNQIRVSVEAKDSPK